MGFSRQEYGSWLPFSSPGDLPDQGIEPRSPALHADSLPTELLASARESSSGPQILNDDLAIHFSSYCCSVTWSCLILCNPMDCSTPDFVSFTISHELKLMSIESVMPSNYLILCRPLLLLPAIFPSIRHFELALCIRQPKHSASASVLTVNIQDWFPLGLTGLISLQFKGLSRVFSNTIVHKFTRSILQRSSFFMVQLSHPYMTTGETIALAIDLCWQSNVSAF